MKPTFKFHKLIAEFPCLVPDSANLSSFSGYIRIRDREFRIRIASDCSRFDADQNLSKILAPSMKVLKDRLQAAIHPHEFLIELRDLTERAVSDASSNHSSGVALPPAFYYERLLSEISELGWHHIKSMNESMRTLELTKVDLGGRNHSIGLTFPLDYPTHPPSTSASLPVPFDLQWKTHSLVSVVQQFSAVLETYQDFFRAMEDLDKNAWILEPEHPSWRECYRRIALSNHCSARIQVDPRMPIRGFPECRFLGSETAIAPFKQRFNENIHKWDTSGNVLPRENLEAILGLTLPERQLQNEIEGDGLSLECGICYSFRLDDRVPDIACDLAECSKQYHRGCLIDWLRALPDTRESFGTISGTCVYCEHPISVSAKAL